MPPHHSASPEQGCHRGDNASPSCIVWRSLVQRPRFMASPANRDTPVHADASHADLPCVLDIEASGFGRGSYPIEIGFVLPDGTAYCTLVIPDETWTHWDGDAERVHGISRSLLQRHGRSVHEVAGELNQRLAGRSVYCDNWAHDYAWLARLFDSADSSPTFRLRHLRELMNDYAVEHFDDARDSVERNLQLRRHRASSDARVLQLSLAKVWRAGDEAATDAQNGVAGGASAEGRATGATGAAGVPSAPSATDATGATGTTGRPAG